MNVKCSYTCQGLSLVILEEKISTGQFASGEMSLIYTWDGQLPRFHGTTLNIIVCCFEITVKSQAVQETITGVSKSWSSCLIVVLRTATLPVNVFWSAKSTVGVLNLKHIAIKESSGFRFDSTFQASALTISFEFSCSTPNILKHLPN